jgi:hypothetical protein
MWRALGLAILLTGCADHKTAPPPPLTSSQQAIGVRAIDSLRQAFNSPSSCGPIYDAAAAAFHAGHYKEDWLRICARLQNTEGPWQKFSMLTGEQLTPYRLDIYGAAQMATGTRHMEIDLLLDGNRAQLLSWSVLDDSFEFPRTPPLRHWDTPPIRAKSTSGRA